MAVAAFAGVSAFNTEEQLPNAGGLIEFDDIVTDIGTTTSFNGTTFTCPSTALYFIRYRVPATATTSAAQCRVDLVVGDVTLEVKFGMQFYSNERNFCCKIVPAVKQREDCLARRFVFDRVQLSLA